MKILLVDDLERMRNAIKWLLRPKKDFEIVEAENGQQALEKLEQEKFDLLITDYQMPVMDGLNLIKHVLADPQFAGMRIILMSTHPREIFKLQEGVDYCDKNELDKLKDMVKKEAQ
ncbi:MAG: response regulator [Patescibacteria group bacterium]